MSAVMNPGTGPDIELTDFLCMECDGKGYVTSGRDWQTEPCPECARQSREDFEADRADADNDERSDA